ncbi:MAG: hypothetical protein VCB25_02720, partial [Myxococcota bacterium]
IGVWRAELRTRLRAGEDEYRECEARKLWTKKMKGAAKQKGPLLWNSDQAYQSRKGVSSCSAEGA